MCLGFFSLLTLICIYSDFSPKCQAGHVTQVYSLGRQKRMGRAFRECFLLWRLDGWTDKYRNAEPTYVYWFVSSPSAATKLCFEMKTRSNEVLEKACRSWSPPQKAPQRCFSPDSTQSHGGGRLKSLSLKNITCKKLLLFYKRIKKEGWKGREEVKEGRKKESRWPGQNSLTAPFHNILHILSGLENYFPSVIAIGSEVTNNWLIYLAFFSFGDKFLLCSPC